LSRFPAFLGANQQRVGLFLETERLPLRGPIKGQGPKQRSKFGGFGLPAVQNRFDDVRRKKGHVALRPQVSLLEGRVPAKRFLPQLVTDVVAECGFAVADLAIAATRSSSFF
jgi:hypothetical protein